jgi:hypothetical protein
MLISQISHRNCDTCSFLLDFTFRKEIALRWLYSRRLISSVVDAKETQEKYAGIFAVRTRLITAVTLSGYEGSE